MAKATAVRVEQTSVERACVKHGRLSYRWGSGWRVVYVLEDGTTTDAIQPYCAGRGAKREAESEAREIAQKRGLPVIA